MKEEKLLCVPCMMNLRNRAMVTLINHKSGKIDCAECGRRRYGSLYQVEELTGKPEEKKPEAKKKGGKKA